MNRMIRGSDAGAALKPSGSRVFSFLKTVRGSAAPQSGVWALHRSVRVLSAFDTVASALDALRKATSGALCVISSGRPIGVLTESSFSEAVATSGIDAAGAHSTALGTFLGGETRGYATLDAIAISADASLDYARDLFAQNPSTPLLAVLDGAGNYSGVLLRSDLAAADIGILAPPRIGGMATPLGVYLTDGVVQAGAGNLGLVLTGVSLTLLYAVAAILTSLLLDKAQSVFHFDFVRWVSMAFLSSSPFYVRIFAQDMRMLLTLPVLLVLLRAVPIAGFHAAEHQTVHAIERGEPLTVDAVRRMPRAHPRCGTNLTVGLIIFDIAMSVMFGVTLSIPGSVVPALIISLILWRPVGTFAQNWLTTRPASDHQIASGIRAGEQVMQRFAQRGIERRAGGWERIWNMGLLQIFGGVMLCSGVLQLIGMLFPRLGAYLGQTGF